ncbi:hypothetical protein CEXT_192161 [Caerostris extrusa]|uniref:Uncharacterized protein n=1 Tax=Caerostris extrusa TaxID=172846 RepID=A0AAV4P1B8_CAEEX|nr:hypothetical protein CEXT_192161 [Caerostris extrusa]
MVFHLEDAAFEAASKPRETWGENFSFPFLLFIPPIHSFIHSLSQKENFAMIFSEEKKMGGGVIAVYKRVRGHHRAQDNGIPLCTQHTHTKNCGVHKFLPFRAASDAAAAAFIKELPVGKCC